ncbi:MAG: outer membrane protein assembly factor BamD [Myxococcota bacterium]
MHNLAKSLFKTAANAVGFKQALFVRLLAGLLVAVALTSCASKPVRDDSGMSLKDARNRFNTAQALFAKKRFDKAIDKYELIKQQFPYTPYAALSDLRIADAHFAKKQWQESADAYELFVRFYPQHEQVGYAAFRRARATFLAMPKGFFLLPAPYLKDAVSAKNALEALQIFLQDFSQRATVAQVQQAQQMRQKVLQRLTKHDTAVAKFYAKRKKWPGAIARYEQAIAWQAADAELTAKSLFKTVDIYLSKLTPPNPQRAQQLLQQFLQNHPNMQPYLRQKTQEWLHKAQEANW